MKASLLFFCVSVNLLTEFPCYSEESAPPLVDASEVINELWRDRDYKAIEAFIEKRLSADDRDVFALAVHTSYAVFVEGDVSLAKTRADRLMEAAGTIGNRELKAIAGSFRDDIYELDVSESGELSQEERDFIHTVSRSEFPHLFTAAIIERVAEDARLLAAIKKANEPGETREARKSAADAEEGRPYHETEEFRLVYEERMRQYDISRTQRIQRVKESFQTEILPGIEELQPRLEVGNLTRRTKDWPAAFEKHGIEFIQLDEGQLSLYFMKWVSKAELIIYYLDPSNAPEEETTQKGNDFRPNPEILKIFDDLWYWSFRS